MDKVEQLGQTVDSSVSSTFQNLMNRLFGDFSLGKFLAAIIVLLICLLATRLILTACRRSAKKSRLDATLQGFLAKLLKVFLIALSVMIAASTLGVDVTSLIAVLGVASLAISLALQGALSNLVGGVMVLTAKPFTVGDMIQCGDIVGVVQSVGLFYSNIMTYDNKHIHVPNSTISSSTIINYTSEPKRIVEITITVDCQNEIDAVKQALRDAAQCAPGLLSDEPILTVISGYSDCDVSYMLRLWVNSAEYFNALFAVNEQIKILFDQRGISMSYPHVDVRVDK